MKIQLRPRSQGFISNLGCKSYYCIEINEGGYGWRFLGSDAGIYRFTTREERDEKIEELRREINKTATTKKK